jgi:NAD(P)-dependent dehydrogenase (short-subunit alcohol dehydrogenase family)
MSTAKKRFREGTAVVTGGGSGLGQGLAAHLGALGMHVVVADIDGDRAAMVAEGVRRGGGNASAHALDVADPAAVEQLAAETFAAYGGVELLFNNAGIETAGLGWEIPTERWHRVLAVNVNGVIHGINAFVPRMLKAGRRAVVANTASVGGVSVVPFQAPYVVSKHAVVALTECLHQELAMVGAPIQVSAVLPYYVQTRIFLDAQTAAPSGNAMADAYFNYMQRHSEIAALDPRVAAERILEGVARGDFWVFSDDAAGERFMRARGAQLAGLQPPPDAENRLRAAGLCVRAAGRKP